MSRRRRSSRGFTILELLVVIFIMLAMTGIAVAAFRQFLDTERIKLAGGQLVSSVRMARQYAMSKRTRVMVELVDPSRDVAGKTVTLDPVGQGYVSLSSPDAWFDGAMKVGRSYDAERWTGFVKFDLSAVNGVVLSAKLLITVGSVAWPQDNTYSVHHVIDDTWDPATISYNNQPLIKAELGDFDTKSAADNGRVFEINASEAVATAVDDKSDRKFSARIYSVYGTYGRSINGVTARLQIQYLESSEVADVDHIAREIRIIPYVRARNRTTGGFTWLLDQDSAALRIFRLPANVHFALAPRMIAVDQYDPADLDDNKTEVGKVYLDLLPDGTCTARPPDKEGWDTRVNTVILRDAVTGDLALLFIPPSSAFTRQRYLFGPEVEAFVAAYSLYSLW